MRDVHRPTFIIVSDDSPANFRAMAPPDRRLCEDTRLLVYPLLKRSSTAAPHRTAIVMSLSDARVGCLFLWNTMLIGQVDEPWPMLCILLASAATGHSVPPIASWCTTAPFVPFFVCAMRIVALSAVISVVSGALGLRSRPLHQRRMSHLCNAMVRFLRFRINAGVVYSPTRSR